MGIPCERCDAPVRKLKGRFCSKRCAALTQNAARRLNGEDEGRFWGQVERGGRDDCWPWVGGTVVEGYGQMRFCGDKLGAHVIAFRLAYGSVPAGKMVLHRCGNRLCCNARHLYAGTHSDNTKDAIAHGTYKTIFTPGHPSYRRPEA